jgi:hypothetical protein
MVSDSKGGRLDAEGTDGLFGGWLRLLTVFIGVATSACALMGYGVAMAYSSVFGFATNIWFDNPLELLTLAGDGMLGLLSGLDKAFALESIGRGMQYTGAAAGALAFAAWCGARVAVHSRMPVRLRATLIQRYVGWLASPSISARGALMRALAVSATAGAIGSMAFFLGVVALVVLLCLIALVPMIGFVGGESYAKAAVVAPKTCVSPPGLRLSAASATGSGAPCVQILDPHSNRLVLGRVIVARSSRVFLYLPEEDRAVAVPVGDYGVRTYPVVRGDSGKSSE